MMGGPIQHGDIALAMCFIGISRNILSDPSVDSFAPVKHHPLSKGSSRHRLDKCSPGESVSRRGCNLGVTGLRKCPW